MTAAQKVSIARMLNRPSALNFISYIFSDFIELHGDRVFRDDPAIVSGIAWLNGCPVTVIGIQKGVNTEDNIKRNFGLPHPEGYRKALRLMLQAEKFNRPVITFINTAGAYCGISAEERGQGEAIAKNLITMASLRVPIISVIIGEGGSGGALALAVADRVWMLENSIYSILSPEGFASILWKDSSKASDAAELMKITANDLLTLGIIDKIIPEGDTCTFENFDFCGNYLKDCLIAELNLLREKDIDELINERYTKFRNFGVYIES